MNQKPRRSGDGGFLRPGIHRCTGTVIVASAWPSPQHGFTSIRFNFLAIGRQRPLQFQTKPAFPPEKRFHPRSRQWLGYVIQTPDSRFYHAGDTGPIDSSFSEPIDLSLVPVDGISTMDAQTALNWTETLPTQKACPIHYGSIRRDIGDAIRFRRGLSNVEGIFLEQTRLSR